MDGAELLFNEFKIHIVNHTEKSCIKKLKTGFKCEFCVTNNEMKRQVFFLVAKLFLLLKVDDIQKFKKHFDKSTFKIVKSFYEEILDNANNAFKKASKRKANGDILEAEI